MEFFNFIETFFFVSLAITFVLIMMLVYHFKERLTIVEKKTNTMFDIITNIVNELNGMRNYPVSDNNNNNINEQIISGTSNVPLSTLFSQIPTKIVVSDNEDDETTDDETTDDESTDDEENDDDNDDEETKIKIINVDLQGNNDENIQFEELNESASSTDEDEELYTTVTDFEAYSNMESEKPEQEPFVSSTTEIKVEKSNKTTNEELTNSYRKMDINALRNLVVERGIPGDIKKLKKIELIRLLDANA